MPNSCASTFYEDMQRPNCICLRLEGHRERFQCQSHNRWQLAIVELKASPFIDYEQRVAGLVCHNSSPRLYAS